MTIEIALGDGLSRKITVKKDGSAVDITGWTFLFTAKKKIDLSEDDTSAVVQKDITSHTDPTNGISQLDIPNTDLTEKGTFFCSIRALDSVGDEYPQSTENFLLKIEDRATKRTA